MTSHEAPAPPPAKQGLLARAGSAAIGVLLVSAAAAGLVYLPPEPTAWSVALALVLAVLGAEAIVSAFLGRWPWISRIGPLP